MTSTTGRVDNQTGVQLSFAPGEVSHGAIPIIEHSPLDSGGTANVFLAMSDGAGVEGNVLAAGPSGSGVSFILFYDNPVVGSNSGSVTSSGGYKGVVDVGSGVNNTITYTLTPA